MYEDGLPGPDFKIAELKALLNRKAIYHFQDSITRCAVLLGLAIKA
jgi:hypothetical protein